MNYRWLTITAALFLSLLIISESYAQRSERNYRGNQRGLMNLNLTDAQKEQIKDLRLDHKEEMIKLRSELALKQLDLEKLESSKDFSRSAYVSAEKDLSAVKNKIAEARANHRMDVYELLDETQKKEFQDRPQRSGRGPCGRSFRNRDF